MSKHVEPDWKEIAMAIREEAESGEARRTVWEAIEDELQEAYYLGRRSQQQDRDDRIVAKGIAKMKERG